MAATDGEGSAGRSGPALPVALVSLIPAKPSLIHPKNGRFLHFTDGEQNVLIRPFQQHIHKGVTWGMPERQKPPVLTVPFFEPGIQPLFSHAGNSPEPGMVSFPVDNKIYHQKHVFSTV